jgi:hypothetical protein
MEIGHRMTLKHPGNYGADEGPFLNRSKENNKYSVMSYRDNPDSGERADHLMLYDIAALQSRDPGKAKVFAAIDPGLDIGAGVFMVI